MHATPSPSVYAPAVDEADEHPIADERRMRAQAWPHRLAVRVVDQAFKDVRSRCSTCAERDEARQFLDGSVMLHYWCHVGALDERDIIARAKGLLHSASRPLLAGRALREVSS